MQSEKVPLDALFSPPAQTNAQISPDKQHISFLAPSDGHLTVWLEPIGSHDAQPLFKSDSDIGDYKWAPDGKSVLFFQDREGDEVFHLFSASVDTGTIKDLTPFDHVTAQNLITDAQHPDEILVGMNKRSPGLFDMYRLNLSTGNATLDTENPGDVLSWRVDSKFQIRACSAIDLKDASTYVRVRDDAKSPWRDLFHAPFEKSLQTAQYQGGNSVIGFCDGDQHVLVVDALHSNTGRVEEWDVASGKLLKAVSSNDKADVDSDYGASDGTIHYFVLTDPKDGSVQAARYDSGIPAWQATDHRVDQDLAQFARFQPCNLTITSRASDDSAWVVHITSSVIPGRYYYFDRKKHRMDALFDEYPNLATYSFGAQVLVSYKARDGREIPAYLTLPPDTSGAVPLVLMPHGGPWV